MDNMENNDVVIREEQTNLGSIRIADEVVKIVAGLAATEAVSYTHLDVYKRQAQGSQVVQNGLADLLFFAGFLSMNLAIFNLLPLPILDGGQILLTILESIVPVIKRIRMPLALTSWLLLLALMIYVTTQDVLRITTVAMVQ